MLNVFLGYACNLKCSYCLQSPDSESAVRVQPHVQPFIDRVIPYIHEHDIREIAYWGGEPFLYWDKIKAIHTQLLAEGFEFDMVKVVTNGTMITEDHVQTLNEWGAYVAVSNHKGFGEPLWDVLTGLDNMGYTSLFSGKMTDSWELERDVVELQNRLGRGIFPFIHWVRATDGCDPEYYFTEDTLKEHEAHLYELADLYIQGDAWAIQLLNVHYQRWKTGFETGGGTGALCHNPKQFAVDLHGNRYGCHHSVNRAVQTGVLEDDFDKPQPIYIISTHQVNRFVNSAACQACPIRSWCKGNCHLSNTHSVDCRLQKIKHKIFSEIDKHIRGSNAIQIDI